MTEPTDKPQGDSSADAPSASPHWEPGPSFDERDSPIRSDYVLDVEDGVVDAPSALDATASSGELLEELPAAAIRDEDHGASAAFYYMKPGDSLVGDIFGPVTLAGLQRMARAGEISALTYVKRGRRGSWFAASRLPGIFQAEDATN